MFLRVSAPQGASLDYIAAKLREIEERTAPLRALGRGGRDVLERRLLGPATTRGFAIFTLRRLGASARAARPRSSPTSSAPPARSSGCGPSPDQPNSLGIRGAGQGLQFAIVGSSFADARRRVSQALVAQMEAGPGLPPGAGLLRDDAAAALHRGRPAAGLGPRHRHRRPRRDPAGGARRPLGRHGLRRRPQLRHQAHLEHRPGARPRRPRGAVPRHRHRRDGADVLGGHPRGAADRARARRASCRCARSTIIGGARRRHDDRRRLRARAGAGRAAARRPACASCRWPRRRRSTRPPDGLLR